MFPHLHLESIESAGQNPSGARLSSILNEIVIEARQRQLHRRLMKELLSTFPSVRTGKQAAVVYQTRTWELKSKTIFFYLHDSLGKFDLKLTCSIFSINVMTFQNWIKKNPFRQMGPLLRGFYSHWYFAIGACQIPREVQWCGHHKQGERGLKVSQFMSRPAVRIGRFSRQSSKESNVYLRSDNVTYILKTTKTAGSGRKVEYAKQEEFIIQAVVTGWETGNPMSKASTYDLLISQFGHQRETDRTEWENKMSIHSGCITPGFSQWLTRVLKRHRFYVRQESISQRVPVDWLQICIDATASIRETMLSAGVTRLINADEMFLQYYPKETHLIAPTNANSVGSNRSEDSKKGCTVMVACEMFQSQIIAPMVIMTGTPDGTLSRRVANWNGPSKVTFHPKHWITKTAAAFIWIGCVHVILIEKIGLIWDAASSHFSHLVQDMASELDITLSGIPPGCTSLIQIWDLIANKPIKQAFKKRYLSCKIHGDPGPGGKYKVERRDALS
jgi:hypothetical protein